MWNPFKKKNTEDAPDSQKMGMVQRLAMKKLMSMDVKQREKMMKKMLNPENVAKNKDKILAAMEQMEKSGMASKEQIEAAKRKMGL